MKYFGCLSSFVSIKKCMPFRSFLKNKPKNGMTMTNNFLKRCALLLVLFLSLQIEARSNDIYSVYNEMLFPNGVDINATYSEGLEYLRLIGHNNIQKPFKGPIFCYRFNPDKSPKVVHLKLERCNLRRALTELSRLVGVTVIEEQNQTVVLIDKDDVDDYKKHSDNESLSGYTPPPHSKK